jgi:hypothetical protein
MVGSASNAALELCANNHHHPLLHVDFPKFLTVGQRPKWLLYELLSVRYSIHHIVQIIAGIEGLKNM